jgi:hypothetical protein
LRAVTSEIDGAAACFELGEPDWLIESVNPSKIELLQAWELQQAFGAITSLDERRSPAPMKEWHR